MKVKDMQHQQTIRALQKTLRECDAEIAELREVLRGVLREYQETVEGEWGHGNISGGWVDRAEELLEPTT